MADLADSGLDLLNLSLGCWPLDGQPPLVVQRAVEVLSGRLLLVAAVGNHGLDAEAATAPVYPAALPGVVAVGALAESGRAAEFTPDVPWIDCYAPGENVVSTYLRGEAKFTVLGGDGLFAGFARWSGTSFATATVSGAIAAAIRPGEIDADEVLDKVLRDGNSVVREQPLPA
jgi:subtilisin family serine protease